MVSFTLTQATHRIKTSLFTLFHNVLGTSVDITQRAYTHVVAELSQEQPQLIDDALENF